MCIASRLRNRSHLSGGSQKLQVICHHVGHEKIDHGILLKSDQDFLTHPNVFLVEVAPNATSSADQNESCECENVSFQVKLLSTEPRNHENAVHLTIPDVVHLKNRTGSFAVLVDFDLDLDAERDPICGFIEAYVAEVEVLFRVPLLIVPPKEGDQLRKMASVNPTRSGFYIEDEECDGKDHENNHPNLWDILEEAILVNAEFIALCDARIRRLQKNPEKMIAHGLNAHQIGRHQKNEFRRVRSAERLAEKEPKMNVTCNKCGRQATRLASICNFCQNVLKKLV